MSFDWQEKCHEVLAEWNKQKDVIASQAETIERLEKALKGMVEQFGFHRVHDGLVNDERQAILNAQEALSRKEE